MTQTLILAGKVGPAFDSEVRVLCQVCKADHITYVTSAMFGEKPLDFSAPIFATCDNCWTAKRNAKHAYAPGEDGAFTMCTCPEGKQCNSCK